MKKHKGNSIKNGEKKFASENKTKKKNTEKWSRLTPSFLGLGDERKQKSDENQIRNPNPNREKREKRAIERREERIKIKRGINLIYKRDVIFAFCECRERDTHTEVFGKRAVGVGTCNGAHSLCTIFFENINPVPEFIDSAFSFVFFFFLGEKWCDSKRKFEDLFGISFKN